MENSETQYVIKSNKNRYIKVDMENEFAEIVESQLKKNRATHHAALSYRHLTVRGADLAELVKLPV